MSFLSVRMVAQCRFYQWRLWHSVVSVSRDGGTVSSLSVGGEGSLTACTPRVIVEFMLLRLCLMIGCLRAGLLCFMHVPSRVLLMYLTCLPDKDLCPRR